MPAVQPGSSNTFIASHEASGKLVVDFSRKPSSFAVGKYAQIVPVDQVAGYYLEMTVEEAGRVLNSDLRDFDWPDNAPAPEGHNGNEFFEFKPFRTKRRIFPFNIGSLAADQASWDILAQNGRIRAQQAMTARTQAVYNVLSDATLYPAAQSIDVTSLPGNSGRWSQSTTARQDIRRSLIAGVELILDNTLAAIDPDDLQLVISTGLAGEIAVSQELVDYIKQSPDALAQIRGELPNENRIHGLPAKLYGIPVVVEKTRKVTSKKKASSTSRSTVFPDTEAYLIARPGGLEGVANAPSFSTISLMMQEEMTVETKHDVDNRRHNGRIVENYAVVMTAPSTIVRFTETASI